MFLGHPEVLQQPEKGKQIQVTPEMVELLEEILTRRLERASKVSLPIPYSVRVELKKEAERIASNLIDEFKNHYDDSYEWLKMKIRTDRGIWRLQDKVVKNGGDNNIPIFGIR